MATAEWPRLGSGTLYVPGETWTCQQPEPVRGAGLNWTV